MIEAMNEVNEIAMRNFHFGCGKIFSRKPICKIIAPLESVLRCLKYAKVWFLCSSELIVGLSGWLISSSVVS